MPVVKKTTVGQRIDKALLALLGRANGATVDFSKGGLGTSISGSKPRSQAPPNFASEYAEWLDRAERLALALEGDVGGDSAVRPKSTTKTLSPVIREYEGRSPEFIAFVEKCSVALVRKVRVEKGLNPVTGERAERPHTSRELPTEYATGQIASAPAAIIYKVEIDGQSE